MRMATIRVERSIAAATAIVLLLVVATASAASPGRGTIVNVELGLKASNGLRAQRETSDNETVTLELGARINWSATR